MVTCKTRWKRDSRDSYHWLWAFSVSLKEMTTTRTSACTCICTCGNTMSDAKSRVFLYLKSNRIIYLHTFIFSFPVFLPRDRPPPPRGTIVNGRPTPPYKLGWVRDAPTVYKENKHLSSISELEYAVLRPRWRDTYKQSFPECVCHPLMLNLRLWLIHTR